MKYAAYYCINCEKETKHLLLKTHRMFWAVLGREWECSQCGKIKNT